MSEKTRRDVEKDIANKAAADPAFRKRFKNDPKGVLADMGFSVRDTITIHVVEESPTDTYVVLPKAAARAGAGGELSDDALDAVSAGQFNANCFSCGAG